MIVIISPDSSELVLPDGFRIEPAWDHRAAGNSKRSDGALSVGITGDGKAKPVELNVVGRAVFASVDDLLSWLEQLKAAALAASAIEHRASGYTRRWDVWSGRYGLQTKTRPSNGKATDVKLTFYPKGEGVVV